MSSAFPARGISRVASSIASAIDETTSRIDRLRRPVWWLRITLFLLALAALCTIIASISSLTPHSWHHFLVTVNTAGLPGWASLVDAVIQDIVFLGIAALFLVRLEQQIKRRRALAGLRKLRSLVHVIEMHQLTKEPESLSRDPKTVGRPKKSSKPTSDQVTYFACCSTMTALCSKTAALYAQVSNDPVVLDVVREIEALSAALSSKLWQKITLSMNA